MYSALLPMLVALVVGSVTAITSVILFGKALSLPQPILLSLTPKSVTAAVAMGISEALGADPSLTAVAVILTGIMGAIIVTPLMNCLRVRIFGSRLAPPDWHHTKSERRARLRSTQWQVYSPESP